MNFITIGIGVFSLLFGLYTIYLRINDPSRLGKLEAMQEQWGEPTGTMIHVITYTILPLIIGVYMVYQGMQGGAFF